MSVLISDLEIIVKNNTYNFYIGRIDLKGIWISVFSTKDDFHDPDDDSSGNNNDDDDNDDNDDENDDDDNDDDDDDDEAIK